MLSISFTFEKIFFCNISICDIEYFTLLVQSDKMFKHESIIDEIWFSYGEKNIIRRLLT